MQAMESALLKKGDVAVGISHSGTNKGVLDCLRNAKDNGATTVGLTTYGKSPMQRLCDYVLMTSTKETVFKSESVTARIAQLAVIDSLVAVISFMIMMQHTQQFRRREMQRRHISFNFIFLEREKVSAKSLKGVVLRFFF